MNGPGKYDDLCTAVREAAEAEVAIVIVLGGNRGSGFSAQAEGLIVVDVPRILRHTADEIERSVGKA